MPDWRRALLNPKPRYPCLAKKRRTAHVRFEKLYVAPTSIAAEYGDLNQGQQSFECLEKTLRRDRSPYRLFAQRAPLVLMRSAPRYVDFEKRIGLPK